jgi:hypothetical protein
MVKGLTIGVIKIIGYEAPSWVRILMMSPGLVSNLSRWEIIFSPELLKK